MTKRVEPFDVICRKPTVPDYSECKLWNSWRYPLLAEKLAEMRKEYDLLKKTLGEECYLCGNFAKYLVSTKEGLKVVCVNCFIKVRGKNNV